MNMFNLYVQNCGKSNRFMLYRNNKYLFECRTDKQICRECLEWDCPIHDKHFELSSKPIILIEEEYV